MSQFLTAVLAGLTTGGIYVLVGMSYNLVSHHGRLASFAQGDFVMLATLVTYSLSTALHLPMLVVLLLVTIIIGFLGPITDVVAVWPSQKLGDPGLTWLISTLGVSLIIENLAQRFWGSPARCPFRH